MSISAKLTTLLLTALIDPDTCLFRSVNRKRILVARQIILTIAMGFFFVLQCVTGPFSNPVNNASEWTSRLNFVLTSVVSLGTVLDVPGKEVLDGVVLYLQALSLFLLLTWETDPPPFLQGVYFDLWTWNLCVSYPPPTTFRLTVSQILR